MPQQDSLKKFRLAAYHGGAEEAEKTARVHSRMGAAKAARLALFSAAVVVMVALVTAAGAWWSTSGSSSRAEPIPQPLVASAAPGNGAATTVGNYSDSIGAGRASANGEPDSSGGGPDSTAPARTSGDSGEASGGASGSGKSGANQGTPERVYVHVAGHVARPGLVELDPGDRIADAIKAAGGARKNADLDRVNLAAKIADGQQIYVPSEDEVGPGGAAGEGAGSTESAPGAASSGSGASASQGSGDVIVNINSGDAAELEKLPGVGPAKAQQIIDWRSEHGRFTSVEALLEVPGIGPATLERLRDQVQL